MRTDKPAKRNMTKYYQIVWLLLLGIGLALISSCSVILKQNNAFVGATEIVTSATLAPYPTPTLSYLNEGVPLTAEGLVLTVLENKVEGCYISKYDSEQCPSQGAALLWVHISRENVKDSSDLPIYSCFWFSLLYRGEELDTAYFHDNHSARDSWNSGGCGELYSSYSDEGWVSFEVPEDIALNETRLRIKSYQGPEFEQLWKLEQ